jgi:hypothetical protein
MSTPFSVSAVGVRPLGGDGALEVVGAHVGERIAGTFVVDAGHGEPLARLLLSTPIVEAARKAVAHHRGPGGLEDILGALDELAGAIAAVDGHDFTHDDVPIRPLEPVPPRAVQHGVDPAREIVEANNRLFFGNPEGRSGNSVFRATAVAGVVLIPTPRGPRPRPYGTFEGAQNAVECWRPLSWQLRELADGIDRQFAAAELVRGR